MAFQKPILGVEMRAEAQKLPVAWPRCPFPVSPCTGDLIKCFPGVGQQHRRSVKGWWLCSFCRILEIKGGQHSLHERHDAVTRHPMLIHRRRQVILFPGSTRKDPVTSGAGVNYAVLPTFIPFGKLGVADSPGKIEADEPQPATKG